MSFGGNLVALRESRSISRKELAEKLDIPYTTLRNYENNQREPGHGLLIKIATLFSVSVDELIGHTPANKKAPSISDGAMKLAKNYDALDRWGKQALRDLAETELARMEDESRFLVETTPAPEPKIIPLYLTPAAAGYASPVFGEDYEDYALTSEDPQSADFAVRLQGDSMEPYFPDSKVVFCNKNPLADGDIGVFVVDGATVCKQYHKEGGVVYLFSLNRKRADADVVFLPSSGRTLVCQGRVITKRRYPVPGR